LLSLVGVGAARLLTPPPVVVVLGVTALMRALLVVALRLKMLCFWRLVFTR